MTFRKWLARINGTEICLIPGLCGALVGYLREPGSDSIALGLVVARVLIRWPTETATPPVEPAASSTKCPVCSEPIVEADETKPMPAPPKLFATPPVVHAECYVFLRYGRVGCQRGECPNCDPPTGQSIRDQARDALAFYKASQGKARPKKEAAS